MFQIEQMGFDDPHKLADTGRCLIRERERTAAAALPLPDSWKQQ
jgi:hypothetical protein